MFSNINIKKKAILISIPKYSNSQKILYNYYKTNSKTLQKDCWKLAIELSLTRSKSILVYDMCYLYYKYIYNTIHDEICNNNLQIWKEYINYYPLPNNIIHYGIIIMENYIYYRKNIHKKEFSIAIYIIFTLLLKLYCDKTFAIEIEGKKENETIIYTNGNKIIDKKTNKIKKKTVIVDPFEVAYKLYKKLRNAKVYDNHKLIKMEMDILMHIYSVIDFRKINLSGKQFMDKYFKFIQNYGKPEDIHLFANMMIYKY